MKSSITKAVPMVVLMPHAPVLIPDVGNGREREAQKTVDALTRVAEEVVAAKPDSIFLVSPHSPRRPSQYGLWTGERIRGDMQRFGQPGVSIDLPNDEELASQIARSIQDIQLDTWEIPEGPIDHGAFVPLYFLTRAGWDGPTSVLSLKALGVVDWEALGQSVHHAIEKLGRRTAVIASGDMSHCLLPDAPCGFQPRAKEFDQEFVERVRAGDVERIPLLDPELRALASEDVVDSTMIAASVVGFSAENHEVFSYEGPFGVGYCVARLFGANGVSEPSDDGSCLPEIAREAIAQKLGQNRDVVNCELSGFLNEAAGVFVTIRDGNGRLRGCRGTIEPQRENIVEETRAVALSSAFHDQRFAPIHAEELESLRYEISVLRPSEPVESKLKLDPHRYGVIISTSDGRRGLMLPGVEGLDTADKQIDATCHKAGIDPGEPMSLERFEVAKFAEE